MHQKVQWYLTDELLFVFGKEQQKIKITCENAVSFLSIKGMYFLVVSVCR